MRPISYHVNPLYIIETVREIIEFILTFNLFGLEK